MANLSMQFRNLTYTAVRNMPLEQVYGLNYFGTIEMGAISCKIYIDMSYIDVFVVRGHIALLGKEEHGDGTQMYVHGIPVSRYKFQGHFLRDTYAETCSEIIAQFTKTVAADSDLSKGLFSDLTWDSIRTESEAV